MPVSVSMSVSVPVSMSCTTAWKNECKGYGPVFEGVMFCCVVVRCSVLQFVAVCHGVLQCRWFHESSWCCDVLQCVAVCCSVLQCVAVCCSVLQCVVLIWVCCMRISSRLPRSWLPDTAGVSLQLWNNVETFVLTLSESNWKIQQSLPFVRWIGYWKLRWEYRLVESIVKLSWIRENKKEIIDKLDCSTFTQKAGDAALMLFAFITGNGSLEPLLEGLLAQIHMDLSSRGFGRNRNGDLRKTHISVRRRALLHWAEVTNEWLNILQDPLLVTASDMGRAWQV